MRVRGGCACLKSDNSLVATYRYDAAGNRVEKAVNGGATERYILSRAEQTSMGIDCWHVIATFDGSDNWKQNFVYRDEIDGIVALEQKDVLDFDTDGNTTEITRNFYHGNALGSVMAISDMTQAMAVSYRYDPYGKVTITRGGQTQSSDPLGQHWGFTGRSLDEETGLWYYRARYYDPETGRFLQRDPLGYVEGPNSFQYVESRPLSLRDPSGGEEEGGPGLQRAVQDFLEDALDDPRLGPELQETGALSEERVEQAIEEIAKNFWNQLSDLLKNLRGGDGEAGGGLGGGYEEGGDDWRIGPEFGWKDGPCGGIEAKGPIGGGGVTGRTGVRVRFPFEDPLDPEIEFGVNVHIPVPGGGIDVGGGVRITRDGEVIAEGHIRGAIDF